MSFCFHVITSDSRTLEPLESMMASACGQKNQFDVYEQLSEQQFKLNTGAKEKCIDCQRQSWVLIHCRPYENQENEKGDC